MIRSACQHDQRLKWGKHSNGKQRYKCVLCGQRFTEDDHGPLGAMRVSVDSAKMVLRLLVEGSSIRSAERVTGIHRDTICKLIVHFGDACRKFMDASMRGLTMTHLQFDEQWTYVYKKQSRLTTIEKEETSEQGDIYLWTCVDQKTKLMPAFLIGKRSADNARRFMMDVASRLVFPKPHASDAHAFQAGGYTPVCQVSTDGFPAYPEAVDLAFGPYVRFGTIIKEYRNANIVYTPSEMVGTVRTPKRNISERERFTICTSHVWSFDELFAEVLSPNV